MHSFLVLPGVSNYIVGSVILCISTVFYMSVYMYPESYDNCPFRFVGYEWWIGELWAVHIAGGRLS